ncbi:MarR family transcriptional regulator [Rathayibacter sp. AY1C3]|nr:MarR family transcriptional regulator [Rathayibacter sp. AY1A4]PPG82050.1 MarR family transcriptional regulator [Rathayibacter sp. AY1E5]PPH27772.1 MarR family transcriptional regulator [Rathayibacter sp. AY1C3]PPH65897.1 MarR family transcriptional regulator [Rathayibacter sp. AY1D7]PPI27649.1 MarR family transcriptional regulator [Rathayibacter sp. AY1B4]
MLQDLKRYSARMATRRDERLADALAAVYDVVARTDEALAPALREYGITATTAHLLWSIDPDEPAPSMSEAAARAHCTPQNVTFLCRQLEARGLVERRVSPTDQRQRVIGITPLGRVARERISALVSADSPLARRTDAVLDAVVELLGPPSGLTARDAPAGGPPRSR